MSENSSYLFLFLLLLLLLLLTHLMKVLEHLHLLFRTKLTQLTQETGSEEVSRRLSLEDVVGVVVEGSVTILSSTQQRHLARNHHDRSEINQNISKQSLMQK